MAWSFDMWWDEIGGSSARRFAVRLVLVGLVVIGAAVGMGGVSAGAGSARLGVPSWAVFPTELATPLPELHYVRASPPNLSCDRAFDRAMDGRETLADS